MRLGDLIVVDTALGAERLHVLEDGQGPGACLVWHGFDSVNRFYHWNFLRKYGRVIRVGLPGHGPVGKIDWSSCRRWKTEHFAEVAEGVCKRYGGGVPLTVVGHSTGAALALNAAIRVPELVGRLLLINPLVWSPMGKLVRAIAKTWLWRWAATAAVVPSVKRKRESVNSFLEGLRPIIGDTKSFYGNPNTFAYTEAGHTDYRRTSLAALIAVARVCSTFDLRKAITNAQLTLPMLLVHGEKDRVSPIAQSEWLAENVVGAKLIRLSGVGHLGYAEREEEFAALAMEWLEGQRIGMAGKLPVEGPDATRRISVSAGCSLLRR